MLGSNEISRIPSIGSSTSITLEENPVFDNAFHKPCFEVSSPSTQSKVFPNTTPTEGANLSRQKNAVVDAPTSPSGVPTQEGMFESTTTTTTENVLNENQITALGVASSDIDSMPTVNSLDGVFGNTLDTKTELFENTVSSARNDLSEHTTVSGASNRTNTISTPETSTFCDTSENAAIVSGLGPFGQQTTGVETSTNTTRGSTICVFDSTSNSAPSLKISDLIESNTSAHGSVSFEKPTAAFYTFAPRELSPNKSVSSDLFTSAITTSVSSVFRQQSDRYDSVSTSENGFFAPRKTTLECPTTDAIGLLEHCTAANDSSATSSTSTVFNPKKTTSLCLFSTPNSEIDLVSHTKTSNAFSITSEVSTSKSTIPAIGNSLFGQNSTVFGDSTSKNTVFTKKKAILGELFGSTIQTDNDLFRLQSTAVGTDSTRCTQKASSLNTFKTSSQVAETSLFGQPSYVFGTASTCKSKELIPKTMLKSVFSSTAPAATTSFFRQPFNICGATFTSASKISNPNPLNSESIIKRTTSSTETSSFEQPSSEFNVASTCTTTEVFTTKTSSNLKLFGSDTLAASTSSNETSTFQISTTKSIFGSTAPSSATGLFEHPSRVFGDIFSFNIDTVKSSSESKFQTTTSVAKTSLFGQPSYVFGTTSACKNEEFIPKTIMLKSVFRSTAPAATTSFFRQPPDLCETTPTNDYEVSNLKPLSSENLFKSTTSTAATVSFEQPSSISDVTSTSTSEMPTTKASSNKFFKSTTLATSTNLFGKQSIVFGATSMNKPNLKALTSGGMFSISTPVVESDLLVQSSIACTGDPSTSGSKVHSSPKLFTSDGYTAISASSEIIALDSNNNNTMIHASPITKAKQQCMKDNDNDTVQIFDGHNDNSKGGKKQQPDPLEARSTTLTNTFSFQTTQSKPIFGNRCANVFNSEILFGKPAELKVGMLGNTSMPVTPSVFNHDASTVTGLFYQNKQQNILFGAKPTGFLSTNMTTSNTFSLSGGGFFFGLKPSAFANYRETNSTTPDLTKNTTHAKRARKKRKSTQHLPNVRAEKFIVRIHRPETLTERNPPSKRIRMDTPSMTEELIPSKSSTEKSETFTDKEANTCTYTHLRESRNSKNSYVQNHNSYTNKSKLKTAESNCEEVNEVVLLENSVSNDTIATCLNSEKNANKSYVTTQWASKDNVVPKEVRVPSLIPKYSKQLRPIIIDGSNLANEHGKAKNTYSCKGIEISIKYFLRMGHKVTAFVPNSTRYKSTRTCQISDVILLEKLARAQHVIFTPARRFVGGNVVKCDERRFVVELAASTQGIILSNHQYEDLKTENDAFKNAIKGRLLTYSFIGDILMIPPDPMGKNGPFLQEFLSFPTKNYS